MISLRVVAATIAAAVLPVSLRACTVPPSPMVRDGVHLIAVATRDTLLAGTGQVDYVPVPGDTARPVYGQLIRVERVGGADAGRLPAGTERVVVVPWGFDSLCQTLRWRESARWVTPGTRGVYTASLRPREHWIGDLPTFDEFLTYASPFPGNLTIYRASDSLMSVEQAFELFQRLPVRADFRSDPAAALRPLLEWARENPGLAALAPADGLVSSAEHHVWRARIARMDVPFAGTYRFSVTVNGEAPRVFHARTRSAATDEWPRWEDAPTPMDGPIRGYSLDAAVIGAKEALDLEPRAADVGWGSLSVLVEPDPDFRRIWRGCVAVGLVHDAFPGDSLIAGMQREEAAHWWERYVAKANQKERCVPPHGSDARFRVRADGSVSVKQRSVLEDGTTLVIQGERLSRVTLPEPRSRSMRPLSPMQRQVNP